MPKRTMRPDDGGRGRLQRADPPVSVVERQLGIRLLGAGRARAEGEGGVVVVGVAVHVRGLLLLNNICRAVGVMAVRGGTYIGLF
jgi:hypothetical protein